jgi:putative endonuclease
MAYQTEKASTRARALRKNDTEAERRLWDHKNGTTPGFTSKYKLGLLVWYERHHYMADAIKREKKLKVWKRDWKFREIEEMNPDWLDLHETIDAIATLVEPKAGPLPSQG